MKNFKIALAVTLITAMNVVSVYGQNVPTNKSASSKESSAYSSVQLDQTPVTSANTIAHLNMAYGPAPLQKLDVYAPKSVSDAPVVLFIHGGEWAKNDKSMVSYKPKFLNDNGVVFVSTNYRLSPADVHPAHVNDIAAAISWIHNHIAEYGGSPKKIFVMGHSAGCHLATLVSLDPRPLATVGLKPSDLSGVLAWSGGAYDLMQKVSEGGMYKNYIMQAFGKEEAGWRDASPVNHAADTRPLPPFLFIYIEPNNPAHLASERLASLIRNAGGTASTRLIENRNHQTAIHLIGAPDDTTGLVLLDFIKQNSRR